MLLALLPGLRHLRPPLFAGAAWLAIIWLAWARHLPPAATAKGLLAQVYGLSAAFGPAVTLGAIAVLAYWIGEFWDLLRFGAQNLRNKRLPRLRLPIRRLVGWDGDEIIKDFLNHDGVFHDLLPTLGVRRPAPEEIAPAAWEPLRQATYRDLNRGVLRLLGTNPELHTEHDRLWTEYMLREALTVPVGILIPVATSAATRSWAATTVAVVAGATVAIALIRAARNQNFRCWNVVLGAIHAGHIPAPALTAFGLTTFGPAEQASPKIDTSPPSSPAPPAPPPARP